MTCVVGLVDKKQKAVYMGADSCGSNSCTRFQRADSKLFCRGAYLIGFTTSYRMGQLLRYAGELPDPPRRSLDRFMATEFINSVRTLLSDGGWAKKNDGNESGGTFLVGVHSRLFRVESDFQVMETACGFDAVGSGEEVALGSLWTSAYEDVEDDPHTRVTIALKAAAQFSRGVHGPFKIQCTEMM